MERVSPHRAPLTSLALLSLFTAFIAIVYSPDSLPPVPFFSRSLQDTSEAFVSNERSGVSYRGTVARGVEHFKKIFYAKDTSGPTRFAPIIHYMPIPGTVVDATAIEAWCPQGVGGPPLPFAGPITNISENCLSLRVARASSPGTTKKLPVLVSLHGGEGFNVDHNDYGRH